MFTTVCVLLLSELLYVLTAQASDFLIILQTQILFGIIQFTQGATSGWLQADNDMRRVVDRGVKIF
jgi:hypothetical protein